MRTFNRTIASDIEMNADYNSTFVPLKNIYVYSIAVNISGTPDGVVKLQVSNDPETNDTQYNNITNTPPTQVPVNWIDVSDTETVVNTADGSVMYNVQDIGYNYVRVVFTDNSSGASTATMSIVVNAKGV